MILDRYFKRLIFYFSMNLLTFERTYLDVDLSNNLANFKASAIAVIRLLFFALHITEAGTQAPWQQGAVTQTAHQTGCRKCSVFVAVCLCSCMAV